MSDFLICILFVVIVSLLLVVVLLLLFFIYLFIYLFICTGCNPTDSGVRMGSFAVNERNMRREKRNPVVPVSTISILKKLDRT